MSEELTTENLVEFFKTLRGSESISAEYEFDDGAVLIEYDEEPYFRNTEYEGGHFDVTIHFDEERDEWPDNPNDVSDAGDAVENRVQRAINRVFGSQMRLNWELYEDGHGTYISSLIHLSNIEPTEEEEFES